MQIFEPNTNLLSVSSFGYFGTKLTISTQFNPTAQIMVKAK